MFWGTINRWWRQRCGCCCSCRCWW